MLGVLYAQVSGGQELGGRLRGKKATEGEDEDLETLEAIPVAPRC